MDPYLNNSLDIFKKKGYSNMVNLGNNCYWNAVIASLSNCLKLSEFYVKNKVLKVIGPDTREKPEFGFVIAYINVLVGLFEKNQTISPKTLYNRFFLHSPGFSKGKQNDAHECLLYVLNILHIGSSHKLTEFQIGPSESGIHKYLLQAKKEFIDEFKNQYSVITNLFMGQMVQKVRCIVCKHASFKYEPFMDIGLSINFNRLNETLDNYFSKQILEKNTKCENCSARKITKDIKMIKLPKYLIVNLKRFSNNLQKITKSVLFESELDVSDYCLPMLNQSVVYQLVSVINHEGTLDFGHYYAYNRLYDGNWVEINDNSTKIINAVDVCTNSAYVLIYELSE